MGWNNFWWRILDFKNQCFHEIIIYPFIYFSFHTLSECKMFSGIFFCKNSIAWKYLQYVYSFRYYPKSLCIRTTSNPLKGLIRYGSYLSFTKSWLNCYIPLRSQEIFSKFSFCWTNKNVENVLIKDKGKKSINNFKKILSQLLYKGAFFN